MIGSLAVVAALCFVHGVWKVQADYNEAPKYSEIWDPLLKEWDGPVNGTLHKELAEQAVEAFQHSYRSYISHGYPSDNVKPRTCEPDEVQGGAAITLLDSLDALLVFGQEADFRAAVPLVEAVRFNRSETIDVFEVTIRSLGGLLSAHVAAVRNPGLVPGYDGLFLRKARDLGDRLMPAFDTPTGIPANFLSLTDGQVASSPRFTCTACVGTLAIEFRLLSYLTGDAQYGERADRAVGEVFARRDPTTGLVGSYISRETGGWTAATATIGPGVDSYYEYLLKMYLIFGDESYLAMFVDQYVGVQRYMAMPEPWNGFSWIVDVQMTSGRMARTTISSLAAFWPGMQASIGLEDAARAHMADFVRAHLRHGWMPDSFNIDLSPSLGKAWPLRPELMESAFMLWSLTGDPRYKRLVEGTFQQMQQHTRCECGYCGVKDVATGVLEDIMESFFLAETLKYMYLLLSNGSSVNGHYVFTTEGHILPILPTPAERAADDDDEYYDPVEEDKEKGRRDAGSGPAAAAGGAAEPSERIEGGVDAGAPAQELGAAAGIGDAARLPEGSRANRRLHTAAPSAAGPDPMIHASSEEEAVSPHAERSQGGASSGGAPASAAAANPATPGNQTGADGGREQGRGAVEPGEGPQGELACQLVCGDTDAATLAAEAAAAKKQFPALTFDPADAALLHKRRCAACRAVQAGLAASPPLPPCDAAKRLFIQLPNCPELPKPPKPEPAKASPRIPSRRARSAARAERANDHAMTALQRIMDAAEELMGHLIEDGAEAADTAAEVEPPEIVIKCRKPPRGLAEVGSCSRPGAPGYKLAVYGLCFLRAARGRLACGRMAVVPAAGAPHPLLSALLPAVLPGRVVMAEVHLHDSTVETLQAAAFDDGTGPQVDLVWDVLRHAGLTDALGVLEGEAGAGGKGEEMMQAAVALQLVPFVEDWLLKHEDFMEATAIFSR